MNSEIEICDLVLSRIKNSSTLYYFFKNKRATRSAFHRFPFINFGCKQIFLFLETPYLSGQFVWKLTLSSDSQSFVFFIYFAKSDIRLIRQRPGASVVQGVFWGSAWRDRSVCGIVFREPGLTGVQERSLRSAHLWCGGVFSQRRAAPELRHFYHAPERFDLSWRCVTLHLLCTAAACEPTGDTHLKRIFQTPPPSFPHPSTCFCV